MMGEGKGAKEVDRCTYSPRSRSQIFSICSGCRYFRELLSNSSISLVGDSIAAGITGGEAGSAGASPAAAVGPARAPADLSVRVPVTFPRALPDCKRAQTAGGAARRGPSAPARRRRSPAMVPGKSPGAGTGLLLQKRAAPIYSNVHFRKEKKPQKRPGWQLEACGVRGGTERPRGGRKRKGASGAGAAPGSWREAGVRQGVSSPGSSAPLLAVPPGGPRAPSLFSVTYQQQLC